MRYAKAITAAAAVAVVTVSACGGSSGPSVAACTKQIVAHPVNGPWPACKGLTRAQLLKATEAAMEQGAKG